MTNVRSTVVGSGLLVAVSLRAAGGRRILIPLHDNIPTRHVPIVTWLLILAAGAAYFLVPRG